MTTYMTPDQPPLAQALAAAPPPAPMPPPMPAAPPPSPAAALNATDASDVAALRAYAASLNTPTAPAINPNADVPAPAAPAPKAEKRDLRTYAKEIAAAKKDDAKAATALARAPVPRELAGIDPAWLQPGAPASPMPMGAHAGPNSPIAAPPGMPSGGTLPPMGQLGQPSTAPPVDPSKLVFATPKTNGFAVPGGGTGVIPAHNVAMVDPAMQARERAAAAAEGAHALQAGEQATQAGLAKGAALGGVVQADRAGAQDVAAAQQAEQDKLQPLIDQRADTMRQRAAMHMSNPDKRSTFGRISDSVAAGLFAAGQGFLHASGPNPILDRIHSDIDREVDRQKEEFARKGTSLNDQDNLFAQVYKMTGDAKQARAAVQSALTQAAKDHVDEVAAKSGAPQARVQARLLKDKIDQTDLERTIAENPRVQAQLMPGAATPAAIREYAGKLTEESSKTGQALSPADANRLAVLHFTGKDVGTGPLPTYGKGAPSAAAAAQTPALAGASTAYDPSRFFQGTDAFKKWQTLDQYNAAVKAAMHTKLGIRSPEGMESVGKAFLASPGDTQATLDMKRKAFVEQVLSRPDSSGGGGAEGEK